MYDTRSGDTVKTYQLGGAGSIINDVTLTDHGARFTDSAKPVLYFVPLEKHGTLGTFTTLPPTGPAAQLNGQFNLNGIRAVTTGES